MGQTTRAHLSLLMELFPQSRPRGQAYRSTGSFPFGGVALTSVIDPNYTYQMSSDRYLCYAVMGMVARILIACGVLIIVPPAISSAEINVTGTAASVLIVAERMPLDTVLSAMSARFQFQYRSAVRLDEIVTGTFSGSLAEALPRLVASYNYFIRKHGSAFELFVLSRCEQTAATAQPGTRPVETAADEFSSRRGRRER